MIPQTPSDVTAEWLSEVLSRRHPVVEPLSRRHPVVEPLSRRHPVVADVAVSPIGTGQTGATYRVHATYSGPRGELPDTFVVKLPSQDMDVRERVALGYRSEFAFYTEVAQTVSVPLPCCYYCEIADEGAQFALLLSDQAPAVQGDQIAGCSGREALLAAQALAGLHGPRWCDPRWLSFAGTVMPLPDEASAAGLGQIARLAADKTLEGLGPRLTSAERATVDEATDLVSRWLMLAVDRFSLLHGDYRCDNLLFDPARSRVTVVDWQTLAVGLPARDLAYFAATSLPVRMRAEIERNLVEAYHRALEAYGVSDYDRETCWQDYRLGMLQAPLITTLGWAFSAVTDRGDEMALAMLRRSAAAIRELDTLSLIRR